jgi:hypothetical protein
MLRLLAAAAVVEATKAQSTWTLQSVPIAKTWYSVAASQDGLLVAVGDKAAMYSVDGGNSWNVTNQSYTFRAVAFGGSDIMAVGKDGRYMTAPISTQPVWTEKGPPQFGSVVQVAYMTSLVYMYSDHGGLSSFFAYPYINTGNQGSFSSFGSDGSSLSLFGNSGTRYYETVGASPDWMLLVDHNGPDSHIYRKDDPQTFYSYDYVTLSACLVTKIAYGNGTFVAVCYSGTVFRSTDNGASWSAATITGPTATWYSVAYGDGLFIAVGSNSTSGEPSSTSAMISHDSGGSWTTMATPEATMTWRSVAYDNTSSKFVAVGLNTDSAVVNRVMTISRPELLNNNQPTAHNQLVTVDENVAITITLGATDPDGDSLTYSIVNGPANGSAQLNGTAVTYISTSDTATADSFTFKANDGIVDSNTATVTITITEVNDPPTAAAFTLAVIENEEWGFDLGASATDPEGDTLTFQVEDNATYGSLTVNTDGSGTYIYTGETATSDWFTFSVSDGTATSNIANVSITITLLNDSPVAIDEHVTVPEGHTVTFTLSSSTDADSTFTFAKVSDPENGTLVQFTTGGLVQYNANISDSATSDSFTFELVDDSTLPVSATCDTELSSTCSGCGYNAQSEWASNCSTNNLVSAEECVAATAFYHNTSGVPLGVYDELNANAQPHWTTRACSLYGNDTYYVHNNGTQVNGTSVGQAGHQPVCHCGVITKSNVATVFITIGPVNDAPVATGANVSAIENEPRTITLVGSDVDTDPTQLQFIISTTPQNGTLTNVTNGNYVTYTSNSDTALSDLFTFYINDGNKTSNTATVTITITPVNDAPVAHNMNVTAIKGQPKLIYLEGDDAETEMAQLAYFIVGTPSSGTLSNITDVHKVTYTAHSDTAATSDSFTFKISDSNKTSNVATVSITIEPPPPTPYPTPVPTTATPTATPTIPTPLQIPAPHSDGNPSVGTWAAISIAIVVLLMCVAFMAHTAAGSDNADTTADAGKRVPLMNESKGGML